MPAAVTWATRQNALTNCVQCVTTAAVKPVALDATLWDEPTTGIGLYLQQLHRALTREGVLVDRWGAERSGEVPRRRWSRTGWVLGPLPALLAARKPRLYHALANFNLPLMRVPGVPFVLTVHDLVPLLLPHTVSSAFRWQFRAWLSRSVLVADQIICVSEVARNSLLTRFEVPVEKVHVIHHGVDHVEQAMPDRITTQWVEALGLSAPWVLYAGSLDARKNVQLVLAAVERLSQRGRPVTLVLAGQRWFGSRPLEMQAQRLRERGVDIRLLGYLAEPAFYALMRQASVFVFPSRYEGFGLPPLEAMRLGVPTIVSTEGALPEICQEGAIQVGPDDVEALTTHLEVLLESAAARAQLGTRGQLHAQTFTWQRAARATCAVYAKLL